MSWKRTLYLSLIIVACLCGTSAVASDTCDEFLPTSSDLIQVEALLVDFFDGFENYACGSLIVGQGRWEIFNDQGSAGDEAEVKCAPDPVFAGGKSVGIIGNDNGPQAEDIVAQFDDLNYGAGDVLRVHAWVYSDSDLSGLHYFILLNDYAPNGEQNWSTQLRMDTDANIIISENDNPQLPLIEDQWVEITVTIDLIDDSQIITYNGELLEEKSWTEGVGGGGQLFLDTLNLWSSNASGWVFYDNVRIEELGSVGAGCLATEFGSCVEDRTPASCQLPDCYFQGYGSTCGTVTCPKLGDDGWIITQDNIPFSFEGDTSYEDDTCQYGTQGAADILFTLDLDYGGRYLFDACDAEWNNYLALGEEVCGKTIEGYTENTESNDSPVCGYPDVQARLAIDLQNRGGGIDYYLGLGSLGNDEGPFGLMVREMCVGPIYDRTHEANIREDLIEPCGEDVNGGCNTDEFNPPLTNIDCGDIITGTFFFDGQERDTDWFRLNQAVDTTMCLRGYAEAGFTIAKIQDSETEDCFSADTLWPRADSQPCMGGYAEVEFEQPGPNTIWLFAGSNFDDVTPCDAPNEFEYPALNNYWFEVICGPCDSVPPPPYGQKVISADGEQFDYFGAAVSLSGEFALVGAYRDDLERGGAYVMQNVDGRWVEKSKLHRHLTDDGDQFGHSVAHLGSTPVVGAPLYDGEFQNNGAVFVYGIGGAFYGEGPDDAFGYDVAADTVILVVEPQPGSGGAAYIYKYDRGWQFVQKLLSEGADDWFGYAVAVDDNTAVVVAIEAGTHGRAYVHYEDQGGEENWGRIATLESPGGASFGFQVAIDGDTIMVADAFENLGNDDDGAVYVYGRNQGGADNWGLVTKLTQGACDCQFGRSVDVSGDLAVVGTAQDTVHVYRRSSGVTESWDEVLTLDAVPSGHGLWSAIDGHMLLVESPFDDAAGTNAGAAHFYDLSELLARPGDANGDGNVDFADILVVLADWGCEEPPDCQGDVNGDGVVNFGDLLVVLANWG